MQMIRKLLLSMTTFILATTAFAADGYPLTFYGSETLAKVKAGEITRTIRLYDRTAGNDTPENKAKYVVNQVAPLLNSNKEEDPRSFADQVTANAYGAIQITALKVTHFDNLDITDKEDVMQWYSEEKIAKAEGLFTIIDFTYQN